VGFGRDAAGRRTRRRPDRARLHAQSVAHLDDQALGDLATHARDARQRGRIAGDFVEKPLLSREGANVTIHAGGRTIAADGEYGAEGRIYQAYAPIPRFGDDYVTIGSWIVGDEPAGIGMREDASPITRNTSRFVPHYFL